MIMKMMMTSTRTTTTMMMMMTMIMASLLSRINYQVVLWPLRRLNLSKRNSRSWFFYFPELSASKPNVTTCWVSCNLSLSAKDNYIVYPFYQRPSSSTASIIMHGLFFLLGKWDHVLHRCLTSVRIGWSFGIEASRHKSKPRVLGCESLHQH